MEHGNYGPAELRTDSDDHSLRQSFSMQILIYLEHNTTARDGQNVSTITDSSVSFYMAQFFLIMIMGFLPRSNTENYETNIVEKFQKKNVITKHMKLL